MWPVVRIQRSRSGFWWAVASITIAHIVLCHPAATCRGYPPLKPEELIACFVAPFFAGFPALFDDRRQIRGRGIIVMALAMGCVYGIVQANAASGRPSIGHLTGLHGVVIQYWFFVIIYSVIPTGLLWLCFYFYERVAGNLWAMFRRFRDQPTDGSGSVAKR